MQKLDMLLHHMYSTSIAEVLKSLMAVTASNFDLDLQKTIKQEKARLMNKLIDKMSGENSFETNMSAQITIQDLIEDRDNRDLFAILTSEDNLRKLNRFALDKASST